MKMRTFALILIILIGLTGCSDDTDLLKNEINALKGQIEELENIITTTTITTITTPPVITSTSETTTMVVTTTTKQPVLTSATETTTMVITTTVPPVLTSTPLTTTTVLTTTPPPAVTTTVTTIFVSRYKQLYEEYSEKIRNSPFKTIDYLADITFEGIGKMADYWYYLDGDMFDDYDVYEFWAELLMDVYLEEALKWN
jgi:hypothetical protein